MGRDSHINRLIEAADRLLAFSNTRKLTTDSAIAFVIKIASAFLSYLMFVALARLLDLEEFGYFGFVFSLSTFFAKFTVFGQQQLSLREIAIALEKKDKAKIGSVKTFSVCIFSIFSMVSIALLSGLSYLFHQPLYFTAIPLAIALGFSELVTSVQRGHGSIGLALFPRDVLWRSLVIVMCGFCTFAIGFQPETTSTTWAISAILIVVVTGQVLSHQSTRIWTNPSWLKLDLFELFKSSVVFFGISVVSVGVPTLSAIVIGEMLPIIKVGPYFAALKTSQLLNLLLLSSNIVASPLIARQYAAGNFDAMESTASFVSIVAGLFSFLSYLLFVAFGRAILDVFGDGFGDAYPELLLLGAGYVFGAFCGPNVQCLQMTGLERKTLSIMIVTGSGTLAIMPLAVHLWGTFGAASLITCGMIWWNLWATQTTRRQIGVDPSAWSILRRQSYVREPL